MGHFSDFLAGEKHSKDEVAATPLDRQIKKSKPIYSEVSKASYQPGRMRLAPPPGHADKKSEKSLSRWSISQLLRRNDLNGSAVSTNIATLEPPDHILAIGSAIHS